MILFFFFFLFFFIKIYFDKYFPNACENVAPICTATPSRPADPPNRCVIHVPIITKGINLFGISSSFTSCATENTKFIPFIEFFPIFLYIIRISNPAKGKNIAIIGIILFLASDIFIKPIPNNVSNTPTISPTATPNKV